MRTPHCKIVTRRCGQITHRFAIEKGLLAMIVGCLTVPFTVAADSKSNQVNVLVVVPEDTDSTEFADVAVFKNPDDHGELYGQWKWKNSSGKYDPTATDIEHPSLLPIDAREELWDSTVPAIRKSASDTDASYNLVPERDKLIEPGGEAKIAFVLKNANRLQPGVYRGISHFGMQLATKAAAASADPDIHDLKLKITIVKCGRRLHRVNLWNIDPDSRQLSFGRTWQLTVEYDEFIGINLSLTDPLQEKPSMPELKHFEMSVDVDLEYSNTSSNVALARLGLRESGFAPPFRSPPNLELLWKDVFFNATELGGKTSEGQQNVEPPNNRGPYLYNSRVNVGGKGPKTWNDPVAWQTKRHISNPDATLADYRDHDSEATWRRRIKEIGFPALDVLGSVAAKVKLQAALGRDNEKRSTDKKEIADGFAIFPQISVVGDPVRVIAAIRKLPTAAKSLKFSFKHETQSLNFPVDISKDAVTVGEGERFSQVVSDGKPGVCKLKVQGLWKVSYSAPEEELFPNTSEFLALAAIKSPLPRSVLIFPKLKPWIFGMPLNSATSEELSVGGKPPKSGKSTLIEKGISLDRSAGVTDEMTYAILEPVHVVGTKASGRLFRTQDQPLCELVEFGTGNVDKENWNKAKVGAKSPNLELHQSPVVYDLQVRFGPTKKERDLPTLDEPTEQQMSSRNIEYLVPMLIHARFGDEEVSQFIFRPINVRVRSDGDYFTDMALYVTIVGGSLLILLGTSIAVIRQQLAQRAEMLAGIEQRDSVSELHGSIPGDLMELPEIPRVTPPQPHDSKESSDETPGIL